MKKILKFEGAGWSGADSNGVGNCRIRATFINDRGETIYLEMGGHASTQYSPPSRKHMDFPWHISHLHKVDTTTGKRDESEYAPTFGDTWKSCREYTRENILQFVNRHLNCSFEAVEVINDGSWNGFRADGKDEESA